MSSRSSRSAPSEQPRQLSRLTVLASGFALGALIGVVMCLILWAVGRIDLSPGPWAVRIVTTALLGMVLATVMGPVRSAKRQGALAPGRARFGRRR